MSKKSPQLRFEGFTDDWEERKLGDILSERNDQMPETNEYPLMSFVQGKGVTPKGERYNRSFLVKDSEKKYKKTKLGDFIYSSNNLETGSIGFNRTGKAVISPVYSIFESKKARESLFIGIMSARKDFISEMVRFRQGVVYGQWRIHESDFLNINIKIPNDKEQHLIISLFESIDNTIALHQRKLDLLKEQKKGYLQKMFPKNGAKVPELRFAGFADDWEERKLKELGDIQTGNTPPTSDSDNYSLDGVLWVTPTDIKSLVISNTAKKLSQVGVTKARIAKAGSILVTSIASIGKNTLLRMDAGFNQQINSLTPTSENDSYFLLTQSEKWSEKMKQTAASATMQIVNKTDFSNISTYVPVHKEEQEKIGSFFKQLDDTIALHQRKLDLLKEQKKGYLQKMFV